MRFSKALFLAAAACPLALSAQQADSFPKAPELSGTLFGNYMYRTGKAAAGQNSFNFERAYLTVKDQLSARVSARATLDVFDAGSGNGYVARLKYGYLQYDYLKGENGLSAIARGGMLHTVFIDHEENFWPHYIAKTPTELAGFFKSADLGAATLVTMPNKWGEIYAAVTNGATGGAAGGYTTPTDADRFKDYQGRLTLTPLASSEGFLKSFDLSGWYYKGAVARGNAVSTSLDRSRWGVFAGVHDPRLTVGVDFAESMNAQSTGATTDTSITGRLWSAYTTLRPFQLLTGNPCPFGIVLRYDQVKPSKDLDPSYSLFIGGVTVDLSKRASFSVDYQAVDGRNLGGASPSSSVIGVSAPKAVYMHWVLNY